MPTAQGKGKELSREEQYDRLKELIIIGKEKGYLSYDEVDDGLPESILCSASLDRVFHFLGAAGIEVIDCEQFKVLLQDMFPDRYAKIRFPDTVALGIKPASREGTERLARAAIRYAIENGCPSVTFVHKGNIMKFTEGAFRDWGYAVAKEQFGATEIDDGPWCRLQDPKTGNELIIKDVIADAMLQQILTRPSEYSVIVTMNLNGDYISDALAACVGGIGIAPGGNINYESGHAIFEATHGTAPKYAGQDKVNPGSVVLSGEMMLRYLGWSEAADLITKGVQGAIAAKTVTYDFERQMEGATLVKCSEFGQAVVRHMDD